MTMKRILSSLIFSAVLAGFSLTAVADANPLDFRRTLFVPVAQKMLVLEAPLEMCFLDQTSYVQGLLFKTFSDEFKKKGDQVLLAAFMDCIDVVNASGSANADGVLPNVGLVTWMNPAIGDFTPMALQDYLDMREASFLQYAENSADGLHLDKTVRRTENGVSVGMDGEFQGEYQKIKKTAIIATTVLRHVPIEVSFRYSGSEPPALDKLYPLVDKFLAQQLVLNR